MTPSRKWHRVLAVHCQTASRMRTDRVSIHSHDRDADALELARALDMDSSPVFGGHLQQGDLVRRAVTQATTWRLGHSLREMMHDRDGKGPQLKDVIEVDIKYRGGAPKRRKDCHSGIPGIFKKASATPGGTLTSATFGQTMAQPVPTLIEIRRWRA